MRREGKQHEEGRSVLGFAWWAHVDLEDVTARLLVWRRELNLTVDAAWPNERGVERLDLIRCEDDLSGASHTRVGGGRSSARETGVAPRTSGVRGRPARGCAMIRWGGGVSVDARGGERDRRKRVPGMRGGRKRRDRGYLNVGACVEAIKLVEQLKHRALDLLLATRSGVVSLGADRVDFVDENDGRGLGGGGRGGGERSGLGRLRLVRLASCRCWCE